MRTVKHKKGIRYFLRSIICLILALIILFPIDFASAISEATWEEYGINGIYYYDATGRDSNCTNNTTGNNVTIIGDSLTDGARSDISKLLKDAKIYAKVSKHFGTNSDEAMAPDETNPNSSGGPSGFSIVKYLIDNNMLGSTVVYALGTNDSSLTNQQVTDIIQLLQGRTIFFITNYNSVNPSVYDGNNNKFETAAENANINIIPWATEAATEPDKYIDPSDQYHVHPTTAGKELFASLIDKAVGGTTSVTAGANGNYTNYAGDQVLTDKQIELLEHNIPTYEQAIKNTNANQYGITWPMIAAIHYAENDLGINNPLNDVDANLSEGIYQLHSYTHPGGVWNRETAFIPTRGEPVSDEEFLRQTELMLTQKLIPTAQGLNLSTDNGIKRLFYAYNGISDAYYRKAIAMGFSEEEAKSGDGSAYVMNRYDAIRDPGPGPGNKEAMHPQWPGKYTTDYHYEEGLVSRRFGVFTVYTAISGGNYCVDGISSGGLNLEQAKSFMHEYIYNVDCNSLGLYCTHGSSGGELANCVTFTQYFIKRFTSVTNYIYLGDGGWVVSNLTQEDVKPPTSSNTYRYNRAKSNASGFTYGGFEPRPFAIFSTWRGVSECPKGSGVKCGHTGVVLGIDQANDKIYIGQAGLNTNLVGYSDIVEKQLSAYTNGDYWYAYTDNIINLSAINEVIGN